MTFNATKLHCPRHHHCSLLVNDPLLHIFVIQLTPCRLPTRIHLISLYYYQKKWNDFRLYKKINGGSELVVGVLPIVCIHSVPVVFPIFWVHQSLHLPFPPSPCFEVSGLSLREFASVCGLDLEKLFQLLHYINRINKKVPLCMLDKRSGMSLSGFCFNFLLIVCRHCRRLWH